MEWGKCTNKNKQFRLHNCVVGKYFLTCRCKAFHHSFQMFPRVSPYFNYKNRSFFFAPCAQLSSPLALKSDKNNVLVVELVVNQAFWWVILTNLFCSVIPTFTNGTRGAGNLRADSDSRTGHQVRAGEQTPPQEDVPHTSLVPGLTDVTAMSKDASLPVFWKRFLKSSKWSDYSFICTFVGYLFFFF